MPLHERIVAIERAPDATRDPNALRARVGARIVLLFVFIGVFVGVGGLVLNIIEDRPNLALAFGAMAVLRRRRTA